MTNKHKHADLIHAWADGATIQTYMGGVWEDCKRPVFYEQYQYRIKPEEKKPVVRWLWAFKKPSGVYRISARYMSDEEVICLSSPIKLEWSRTEFPE